MAIQALEGVVENGRIRLDDDVTLPEQTRVYVIIPELKSGRPARIMSPRLANPEQAAYFVKALVVQPPDAEQ
jgi:hypothetical protein